LKDGFTELKPLEKFLSKYSLGGGLSSFPWNWEITACSECWAVLRMRVGYQLGYIYPLTRRFSNLSNNQFWYTITVLNFFFLIKKKGQGIDQTKWWFFEVFETRKIEFFFQRNEFDGSLILKYSKNNGNNPNTGNNPTRVQTSSLTIKFPSVFLWEHKFSTI
jgi:hypothetical protein